MRIKSEIAIYFIMFTILVFIFFFIATYLYAKTNINQLVLTHLGQVAEIKENKINEMQREGTTIYFTIKKQ